MTKKKTSNEIVLQTHGDDGKGAVIYCLEKSKQDDETVFSLCFTAFSGDAEMSTKLPMDLVVAKWLIQTLTDNLSQLEKAKEIR
jgi:hypothetical protein